VSAGGGGGGLRLGLRCGRVHTAADLVCTPVEKAALFRETGALAVDMEHAVVREVVVKAGVEFVGVRAVADTAADGVDPDLLKLIDETGRPRALVLAGALMRRPSLLGSLLRMRAMTPVALRSLGAAVRAMVETVGGARAGGEGT
jgi:adenosylhomocysteine nucleosidase